MQRIYSGATAFDVRYASSDLDYYFNSGIAIGQISNNIYFGTWNSNRTTVPIRTVIDGNPYPKYNLLDDTVKDAILDLLPESWLMYMKNGSYDCTKYVYQYNHDDLVADGIEQS